VAVGGRTIFGKGVGEAGALVGTGVGHSARLIGSWGRDDSSSSKPKAPQAVSRTVRIIRRVVDNQSLFIALISFL
jgi:hypothetical protein